MAEDKDSDREGKEVARRALAGLKQLFLLSFSTKAFTFLLNLHVIRHLHPTARGLTYVVESWVNSTLFLQREAIRTATHRFKQVDMTSNPAEALQQLMALGWMSIPWGVVVLFTVLSAQSSLWDDQISQLGLLYPLTLYAIGCILEMVAEPAYLLITNLCLYDVRIKGEGLSLGAKMTYLGVRLSLTMSQAEGESVPSLEHVLKCFGEAQIVHGLALNIVYHGFLQFSRSKVDLKWSPMDSERRKRVRRVLPSAGSVFLGRAGVSAVGEEVVSETMTFALESLLRLFLTEGERWVMMGMVALSTSGAYDVVRNLASLVPRLLFLPVEEMFLAMWGKMLGQSQSKANVQFSADALFRLYRTMLLFGAIIVVFGVPFAEDAIYVLLGLDYARGDAPRLLAWYCLYIPFMGLCGVSEAFIRACAEIRLVFQFLNGLFYLAMLYNFCLASGAVGVILANILSMAGRISYCLYVVIVMLRANGGRDTVLNCIKTALGIHPATIASLLVAGGVSHLVTTQLPLLGPTKMGPLEPSLNNLAIHFATGASSLLVVFLVVRRFELPTIKELFERAGEKPRLAP